MSSRPVKPPPASLSARRRLLFAVIATGISLGALETSLALWGIAPGTATSTEFQPAAAYLPLFVTDSETGIAHTAPNKLRFFNRQTFPATRRLRANQSDDSTRKTTCRIFCVGGSTTYGRPYNDRTSFAGWLRLFLPDADPSQNWEVINAGGISYSSRRVLDVMHELAGYDPELFIVYTGHNEFLEKRVRDASGDISPTLRWTAEQLRRSHIGAALHQSAKWISNFLGTQPGEGGFQTTLPAEVRTRLDGSLGPQDFSRDEQEQSRVIAEFRDNVRQMIRLAQSCDAEIVFVVPACNLKDAAPFHSLPSPALSLPEQLRLRTNTNLALQQLEAGDPERARTLVDEALQLDDRYAKAHYIRGKVLLAQSHHREAEQSFWNAVDEDVCPLRCLSLVQQIVRQTCCESHAQIVDFPHLLRGHCAGGIPGDEVFLDHVHPTIRAHRMLAAGIVDVLAEAGTIRPRERWGEQSIQQIRKKVEASLDAAAHGIALRNLSYVLGWAGKDDRAAELAREAVRLAPDDAETRLHTGRIEVARGNLNRASEHFAAAESLSPDLAEASAHLAIVLARLGKFPEAATVLHQARNRSPDARVLLAVRSFVRELAASARSSSAAAGAEARP